MSASEALKEYDVDVVLSTDEVNSTLAGKTAGQGASKRVFAISEQVSPDITFSTFNKSSSDILRQALDEARTVKDAYEVALLRRANDISAKAHTAVLKSAKAAKNERELEATFIATCLANGCREQSYHPIFASGVNGAILHYLKNEEELVDETTGQRKLNLLVDAGGEYRTYCADITRVFPLSGKFSSESRQIYDIVLEMQRSCFTLIKAGVQWEEVHKNAHHVAIRGLLALGILRGTQQEIFDSRVSVAFFPHGLGHYLGMDTHDVGGNPKYDDTDPMFRYLRVRGKLVNGGVITVEPGVSQ